jgi:hypothetical protein
MRPLTSFGLADAGQNKEKFCGIFGFFFIDSLEIDNKDKT